MAAIKDKDIIQPITISDFARIQINDTSEPCNVKVGDVIEVIYKKNFKKIIGIVTFLHKDKMRLLINNSQVWWSRYVNYKIIAYNKK